MEEVRESTCGWLTALHLGTWRLRPSPGLDCGFWPGTGAELGHSGSHAPGCSLGERGAGLNTWRNPVKVYINLKDSGKRVQKPTHLAESKTSLTSKFPCLLNKPVAYQSGVAGLPSSPCSPRRTWGPVSKPRMVRLQCHQASPVHSGLPP